MEKCDPGFLECTMAITIKKYMCIILNMTLSCLQFCSCHKADKKQTCYNECVPAFPNQTFLRGMKISCVFSGAGSSYCSIYEGSRLVFFDMFWSLFKQKIYYQKT